ncbi:unnamed protein product [Amoebophrya sp. A25]|nr:unnamed protein product [Amoebophrya sp. A25]|eukprot:GSA25T00013340001.1
MARAAQDLAKFHVPAGQDAVYVIRRMDDYPACHEKILVPMDWRANKNAYNGAMFRRDVQRAVMEYDKLDYLPLQCVKIVFRPHNEAKDAYSVLYTALGQVNLVTESPSFMAESGGGSTAAGGAGKTKSQKSSIENAIWALDGTTTVDAVVNGSLRMAIQRQNEDDDDSRAKEDRAKEEKSKAAAANPNKFLEIPTGILSAGPMYDSHCVMSDNWQLRDYFNDFEDFEDHKTDNLIEIETFVKPEGDHSGSGGRVLTFNEMLENQNGIYTQEEWETAIYMIPVKQCPRILDGKTRTEDELMTPGELHRRRVKEEQIQKAKEMQEATAKEAEKKAREARGLPPLPEKEEDSDEEDARRQKNKDSIEFPRGLREIGHVKYPTHLSKFYDTPLLRCLDKLDRLIAQTQSPYVTDGKTIKKTRSLKNCVLALLSFNRKFTNINALSEADGYSAAHKVLLKFLLRGRDDAEDSMAEIFSALVQHPYINLETRELEYGKTVMDFALDIYWGQISANSDFQAKPGGGFPEETRFLREIQRTKVIGPERKYLRHTIMHELFEPFWIRDSKMRPVKPKPYLKCFRNRRNEKDFRTRRDAIDVDEEMEFRVREARLLKNYKFVDALGVSLSWDVLDVHNARARDQDTRFDGLQMIDFIKNSTFRRIRRKQVILRAFHSFLARSIAIDIQKSWGILLHDLYHETGVDVHMLMTYPDVLDGNNVTIHKLLRVGTVYDKTIALTGECAVEMMYDLKLAAPTRTKDERLEEERKKKSRQKQLKLRYGDESNIPPSELEEKKEVVPFFQSYVDASQSFVLEFQQNRLQPIVDWSYNVIANRMVSGDRSSVFLALVVAYVRSPLYREVFSSKVGRRWLISFFVRYRMFADWDAPNTDGQTVLGLAAASDREFHVLMQSVQAKCFQMQDAKK